MLNIPGIHMETGVLFSNCIELLPEYDIDDTSFSVILYYLWHCILQGKGYFCTLTLRFYVSSYIYIYIYIMFDGIILSLFKSFVHEMGLVMDKFYINWLSFILLETKIIYYSTKKKARKEKVKFSDTFPSSNLFKWKVGGLYTHKRYCTRV